MRNEQLEMSNEQLVMRRTKSRIYHTSAPLCRCVRNLLFFICYLLFANCYFSFASDFGLILNGNGSVFNNENNDTKYEYSVRLIPRFSTLIGDNGSLYVSALAGVEYEDEFKFVPELLRTELAFNFGALGLKLGRFTYSDPLGTIANGLFDGLQFTHRSPVGRLSFGAWYTGLLYKKSAYILMTVNDQDIFTTDLDYGDFFDTYFAPRRLVAAIDWEHPSIAERLSLKLSLLGQMDLSDSTGKLHTQYLTVKMGVPLQRFMLELGGAIEAAQNVTADDTEWGIAFAGELGLYWTLPTTKYSRLALTGRYTSGKQNETLGAFDPITTIYCGTVFRAKMTGMTIVALDYSARLIQALGLKLNAAYYIRNDYVTLNTYPISNPKDKAYFLGSEFTAGLIWSPVSDIQFNLGGGIFVPALGNVWPDARPQWRVDLSAVLSLY